MKRHLRILKKAGCKINEQNVRMDRHFVMEMVAKAPSTFDITPRNVNRKITVGGPYILFGNVSSPPAYWDLEIGKKIPGSREMFADFCKLSQYFNCIHFLGGYPVEPVDLHPSTRHLDAVFDKLILSDKVAHAYSLGKERVEDVMEMVRIAGNLSHEEFETSPKMFTNINSTSPLKHDEPMLDGWMRLAKKNQALNCNAVHFGGGHGSRDNGWGSCAIHSRSSMCGCFSSIYSTWCCMCDWNFYFQC